MPANHYINEDELDDLSKPKYKYDKKQASEPYYCLLMV
jgi:hypothetical protein